MMQVNMIARIVTGARVAAAAARGASGAVNRLAASTLCAALLVTFAIPGQAAPGAGATAPAALTNEAALRRLIEERVPGIHIAGITRTPYSGLIEVHTNDNELFYTDEKVSFLFVGAIRDGNDLQRNLTEERLQALTAIQYADLPFEGSFKIVRGTGRRQLAYFSDPTCPYCKQLEKELARLDDITINVFLYPILSAEAMPKSRAIWCTADRGKSWLNWMINGVAPSAGMCNSDVIDRNLAFGRKIRVNSVPTLVLANGTRLPGMRTVAEISRLIDEAGPRR